MVAGLGTGLPRACGRRGGARSALERLSGAALSDRKARRPDPDVPRGDHRRFLADPPDPGRSDRTAGRRAGLVRGASCPAAGAVRLRQAALAAIPLLSRRPRAGRPRPLDRHPAADPPGVPEPVPGDCRTVAVRAVHRDHHWPAGRHHRRGQPGLHLRPRAHGPVAHRLLDADLLVGAAADHLLLRQPRLDAGLWPHRHSLFLSAGDRLHADRQPAVRAGGRIHLGGRAT